MEQSVRTFLHKLLLELELCDKIIFLNNNTALLVMQYKSRKDGLQRNLLSPAVNSFVLYIRFSRCGSRPSMS